jgi:hypothetical protein
MAKTKTFGVRLTPELISELERLKDVFAFSSYGEMMEHWVRLLQNIDDGVCQINTHPKEWTTQDVREHLHVPEMPCVTSSSQVDSLTLRRLRERFGEDGLQRIQEILKEPKRYAVD